MEYPKLSGRLGCFDVIFYPESIIENFELKAKHEHVSSFYACTKSESVGSNRQFRFLIFCIQFFVNFGFGGSSLILIAWAVPTSSFYSLLLLGQFSFKEAIPMILVSIEESALSDGNAIMLRCVLLLLTVNIRAEKIHLFHLCLLCF